jgi:RsiW-degrading membrane proteinase PrsW (M82 family)
MAVDQDQTPREASAVNLLGILVGYGISWFLIDRIGRGRNWARMLYLVMTVIGSPFLVMSFRQEMEIIPVQAWISVGLMGLQIVAVIALFQQESSNWYRQMKLNI